MDVNDEYFHALDRGYAPIGGVYGTTARSSHMYVGGPGNIEGDIRAQPLQGLGLKNIGISTPPMKDQVEALKSRIFQGASKVELGFMGRDKGSMGQGSTTPDMYDREMRQAIKEMADLNQINLTVHVTPSIASWCGLNQGRFDKNFANQNVGEAKRTIDFAADVTKGGAVVIHTGEFPRSIYEHFGEEGFEAYPEEKEEAIHYLVDPRTGQISEAARENEIVYIPVEKKDDDGSIVYITDEAGDPIVDDFGKKIPIFETENGQIKVQGVTFSEFRQRSEYAGMKASEIAKDFFIKQRLIELEQSEGQAQAFGEPYWSQQEDLKDINRKIGMYQAMKENMDEETFRNLTLNRELRYGQREDEDALSALKRMQQRVTRQISYAKETLLSHQKRKKQMEEMFGRLETIEEYGVRESARRIADLGMYTWERTKAKQKVDKDFKPLFIAPENIFPESYGAHPDELKKLVLNARKDMVRKLEHRGITGSEAEKLAGDHIKATFDIGHVYVWRKYFTGSDEDFDEWIMDKLDDLNKHKVIGHLHVSDNFGFSDEHATPGTGKVPIKEFIDKMKKAGFNDVIVEPAHQDFKAMLGGWSTFGSSVYGRSMPGFGRDKWTDIESSYFGKVGPPAYIVGDYSPSQDFRGSPFYTGVPFE